MSVPIQFSNYSSKTLLAAINAVQLTIVLNDVAGLPTVTTANGQYFWLTIVNKASVLGDITPTSREIVKVTDITGTTLTVVRGQDGTSGTAFAMGDYAEVRFNAQAAYDLTSLWSNVLARCNVYQESGETVRYAYNQYRGTDPGPHNAIERAMVHIQYNPVGSGTNGPTSADTAFQISNIKHNYPSSGVQGETDGINVVVRNDLGDAAAFVANVQIAAGFGAAAEWYTTQVPPGGGAETRGVNVQFATIDTPSNQAFGAIVQSTIGPALGDAIRIQSVAPGAWINCIQCVINGVSVFAVSPIGDVNIAPLTSHYYLGGLPVLGNEAGVNNYTSLFTGSGVSALRLGGTADPTNYYGNTTHAWHTLNYATLIATLNVSSFDLLDPANGYYIGGVERLGHSGAVNRYTALFSGSGVDVMRLGGTADPVTYFGNTTHAWYTLTYAALLMTLDPTELTLGTNILFEQAAGTGARWIRGMSSESITLSTVGLTTDSSLNLLPGDAVIEAVCVRVTTTITTTTNWAVGDPTTAARFSPANATLVAGTTSVGLDHWSGAVTTLAAGPSQATGAKIRITCTGANPGAGVVHVTVFHRSFVAPTS